MRTLLLLALTLLTSLPSFAASEWISVESKVFGHPREVLVGVPDSYGTGTQRYGVIYVTDGATQTLHTMATAKALSDTGRMPEMIVVGVRHDDRIHELTPTAVAQATVDGEVLRFPTSGGASRLRAFIETELIPEIEMRYRTQPYRILAGHSFGGMFALDTLFTSSKLFNAIVAISPTTWWDEKYLIRRARQFVQTTLEQKRTIVLAAGKESPLPNAAFDELKAVFAQPPRGLAVHTHYFEDEDHVTTAVPATYSALRKLFAPWYFKIDSRDDISRLWLRAQAHAQELSKEYGYRIPVAEERANHIGYLLLRANRSQEALQVFQANVAAYPGSANAFDSLGDAYNATGDAVRAWQNYERAVSLARSAKDPYVNVFERKLADFKRRNPMLFPPQIRR